MRLVGCSHVSGLFAQHMAAGLDEVRGPAPSTLHRARRRHRPLGFASPRLSTGSSSHLSTLHTRAPLFATAREISIRPSWA